MTEVKYTTTSVVERRAGYVLLVSEAEGGRSLVVAEPPAGGGWPPQPDRARALVLATGRLIGLVREGLAAAVRADFRPGATVVEVLALHSAGGVDCYRTPGWGALEVGFADALAWVTGRGVPPQVRRFAEGLVDGERKTTGECGPPRCPVCDLVACEHLHPRAEGDQCEASPETATGTTRRSCPGWPGTSSSRPAAG